MHVYLVTKIFTVTWIYQKTFLVKGKEFLSAKTQLTEERFLLYFFDKIPEAILKPSTNESPIVWKRETFVDRVQFFRDATPDDTTLRIVVALYAAFLRLLTNGFSTFRVSEASTSGPSRPADISDRFLS